MVEYECVVVENVSRKFFFWDERRAKDSTLFPVAKVAFPEGKRNDWSNPKPSISCTRTLKLLLNTSQNLRYFMGRNETTL